MFKTTTVLVSQCTINASLVHIAALYSLPHTSGMKKILIVENDSALAQLLGQILSQLQHDSQVAKTVTEAYTLLERVRPDLIILDRLLPDGDGIEIATYAHESFFATRVLCISTLGSTKNRIEALEVGVDDYLPKPFSIKELELKLKRLLFSEKVMADASVSIGLLRFFPESGMIACPRFVVQLRKKESAIFLCLCRHKHQVLSREKIIALVWQGQEDQPTASTLDVYIRRIRGKLGRYSTCIKTTRGFGYSISDA